jgi:hypothetical protein
MNPPAAGGKLSESFAENARHPCMPKFFHHLATVLLSLVILAAVGWFDYATGYEIKVGIFYGGVIAYATWRLNLVWGVIFCLLCVATWYVADTATRHVYSHQWIKWEDAGMHFLWFFFLAYSFNFFKRTIEREKTKVHQLQGMLPICSCCHRISGPDGYWNDLTAYLSEHTGAQPQRKLCPECARTQYLNHYSG